MNRWELVAASVAAAICLLVVLPTSATGDDTTITANFPLISNVSANNITTNSANISWNTTVNGTSQVFYDTASHAYTDNYTYNTTEDTNLVTVHSVLLTGLSASTKYYYRVKSAANSDNVVSDEYTFTTLAAGGGGGGGGGAARNYVQANLFGQQASYRITSDGEIMKTIQATAENGTLTITIPEGTLALDQYGYWLSTLEAGVNESPPPLPENVYIMGLAYDFSPSGATFEPPITFTFTYDPALIPEGVAEEELVIAMWDAKTSEWVNLASTVDPETNTITAKVSHFSTFAILAYTQPAVFTTSLLAISPAEADIRELVTISVVVANTGRISGNSTVTLTINNLVIATKDVTIAGGDSQKVTFTTAKDVPGTYTVNIDGLSGTFMVKAVPPVFATSALIISPTEADIGELVTISVLVTNTGGMSGSHTVTLTINNLVIATKDVTIAGGTSEKVTFATAKDVAGSYSVSVDGLSGSFTVVAPAPVKPRMNWLVVGGTIAAGIVVGLLIFFLVIRRMKGFSI